MAISELQLPAQVKAHSLADSATLAETLAGDVAERLRQAIAAKGQACLVLSGGRSPVPFLERLAGEPLDWAKVTVSLADERWVPVAHADSNAGLLARHLFTGEAAKARFVGLYHCADNLEAAAALADQALAELPPIDVLVLGMGDDGHTASLFPASPNLAEGLDPAGTRRCLPMLAPSVPRQRLSMSRALLASAGFIALSVQGLGKLATLRAALAGADPTEMPIRAFLHDPLDIYWCP
ncbi:6-phosphogluconolactonase [Pseudomonas sp. S 311-6]|uniref:6-phosphogluconolactonase n=1 Tax=Pseudomonas TaxID=286 RepID=UPI001CE3FDEB|nr:MULTISPECIES: 6-phosphogluconolactonase [Pseudomonas]MCO7566256.1 6-phosphogluconolactonase [Pseudomonas mosselii]MCO7618123.1 6-phosphogluconolactonase [Pseudomonas guariconensis]MCO7631184.1 6-phosphogluconolactonase [Pseudomonas guariconensis]MCO7638048.1 6-phosphogluconolactonase [Pseudomonas sp. S 311-6]